VPLALAGAANQHAADINANRRVAQGARPGGPQAPASDGKGATRKARRRRQGDDTTTTAATNAAINPDSEDADYVAQEIRPGAVAAYPGQDGPVYRTKGQLTEQQRLSAGVIQTSAPSDAVAGGDDTPGGETCDDNDQEQPPPSPPSPPPAMQTRPEESSNKFLSRGRILLVLASLVVVALGLGLGLSLGGKDESKDESKDGTNDKTEAPTFVTELQQHLEQFSADPSLWEDPDAPQSKALDWVVEDGESDTSRVESRWALAVLYFATRGEEWKESFNFLTASHECEWNYDDSFGTTCNDDKQVIEINLGASISFCFVSQINRKRY
jgi:hypothetical protein